MALCEEIGEGITMKYVTKVLVTYSMKQIACKKTPDIKRYI